MTTVDGMSPEFGDMPEDEIRQVIRRAEMDLRLSRNDPARTQRVGSIMDAALAELVRRLTPENANPS